MAQVRTERDDSARRCGAADWTTLASSVSNGAKPANRSRVAATAIGGASGTAGASRSDAKRFVRRTGITLRCRRGNRVRVLGQEDVENVFERGLGQQNWLCRLATGSCGVHCPNDRSKVTDGIQRAFSPVSVSGFSRLALSSSVPATFHFTPNTATTRSVDPDTLVSLIVSTPTSRGCGYGLGQASDP